MKISYDQNQLNLFNRIDAPPPYLMENDKRRKTVNLVYSILFARAVFNKTGDTKIQNKHLVEILKLLNHPIEERQVIRSIETLVKTNHVKVFYVTNYSKIGPLTERYIRVLSAHARLNYVYEKRTKVFKTNYKSGFDPAVLDHIQLLNSNLKFRTVVETTDQPIVPEPFIGDHEICTPEYMEAHYYPVDVTEKGMTDWEKVKLGIVPAFVLDFYNQILNRWDYGDPCAILILGSQKGLDKLHFRIKLEHRSSTNAIPSG